MKFGKVLLQILSLLIFAALVINAFRVIDNIIHQSKKSWEYNLGYFIGACLLFALLFWLNVKLYKFASKK